MTSDVSAPPSRHLRWAWPVLALGLLAACSSAEATGQPDAATTTKADAATRGPAPMTVAGKVTLKAGKFKKDGSACAGKGAFKDVAPGAQVTVTDKAKAVVGIGEITEAAQEEKSCALVFSVEHVPAGMGPYSVEVGEHGATTFEEADLGSAVELKLG